MLQKKKFPRCFPNVTVKSALTFPESFATFWNFSKNSVNKSIDVLLYGVIFSRAQQKGLQLPILDRPWTYLYPRFIGTMVRVTATFIGLNPLSGRTALLIEPGYRVHNRILHVCNGPHFIERYGIFQMMQCKYLKKRKRNRCISFSQVLFFDI